MASSMEAVSAADEESLKVMFKRIRLYDLEGNVEIMCHKDLRVSHSLSVDSCRKYFGEGGSLSLVDCKGCNDILVKVGRVENFEFFTRKFCHSIDLDSTIFRVNEQIREINDFIISGNWSGMKAQVKVEGYFLKNSHWCALWEEQMEEKNMNPDNVLYYSLIFIRDKLESFSVSCEDRKLECRERFA